MQNTFRTQLNFREVTNENYADFCRRISKFAGDNPAGALTGHNKPITLLTTEAKSIGDFIYEQEIVGIVDIDYVISARSIVGSDFAQTRYCGRANVNTRSPSTVCLYESQSGLYFLETTSIQTHRFSKTTRFASPSNEIILESKNEDGSIDFRFQGQLDADKKSIKGSIDFGNGAMSLDLTKGT